MTEDEMVRQHHCLSRHEFEKTPGDGEGLGSLVQSMRLDMTQKLNNNNTIVKHDQVEPV